MTVVTRNICLNHQFLNADIEKNILSELQKNLSDQCTKEYGYFISIDRLKNIKNNHVTSGTSDVIIEVEFEITNLKPDIGIIYTGKICQISHIGILLKVQDKLKALIPYTYLSDYEFDQKMKAYVHEKNSKLILEGENIQIEVVDFKYAKSEYQVIAKLHDIFE